jgi:putative hydrolase of the HAD superfamily
MDRASSSQVKAVILDYGEVLCYSPTPEEWARMAGLFGVDPVPFRKLWDRNRLLYDRGDLSPEAYWSAVAKDAGTQLAPPQLPSLRQWDVEMWAHENPIMVAWLKQIHSSGIRTGLLSNMPHDMIRHVRHQFAWLEYFDHQTFSAEVELIKPDAAIYEHSLRGVEVRASEALFVDDKEPNVQGARAVGMRALQFRSMEQFVSDLERLGFPMVPALKTSSLGGAAL